MPHTSESAPAPAPIVLIDDAHTYGGTQVALAWLVHLLLEQGGHAVVCICTAKTRAAILAVTGGHARLLFIEAPPAMPLNAFRFPVRIPAYLRILKQLRQSGVRFWWLNLPDAEFGLAPLIALRWLGIRPCSYLHGTTRFRDFYQAATWPRRWLSRVRDAVADHLLFRFHSLLVAPSQSSQKELVRRLPSSGRPNTAFLYPPGPPPTMLPLSSVRGEQIDLWILGSLLQVHKNQRAALQTTAVLRRRGFDARLTVAGTGPDLDSLKDYAADLGIASFVEWPGWLEKPWTAAPRNAVILVPSWYETLSLVTREALGEGLRVVVSPLQVFHEWIPSVLIAKSFAPEDFADCVLSARAMDVDVLQQAISGALARFDPKTTLRKFAMLCARAEMA